MVDAAEGVLRQLTSEDDREAARSRAASQKEVSKGLGGNAESCLFDAPSAFSQYLSFSDESPTMAGHCRKGPRPFQHCRTAPQSCQLLFSDPHSEPITGMNGGICRSVAARPRSSPFPQDGSRRILPDGCKSGKLNESLPIRAPSPRTPVGTQEMSTRAKTPDLVDWTCPIRQPS
jgi:hypothetical protein